MGGGGSPALVGFAPAVTRENPKCIRWVQASANRRRESDPRQTGVGGQIPQVRVYPGWTCGARVLESLSLRNGRWRYGIS